MRNRLLNYKVAARSGSVEIVGEHPVAVWEIVFLAKRAMVFRGRPDEDGRGDSQPGLLAVREGSGSAPTLADQEDADAFEGLIETATAAEHRDTYLETRVPVSALPTKLLRLSDTARLTLEEQGVATLFLALGFLRYFEAESSDVERRAPLLLVPVKLEREGNDRWRVRMGDDEPLVNPALVEYLREQHRLVLPALPESLDGYSPLEWFREVQRLVVTRSRWRIGAKCILGIFSFQKFVMHEDLKRNVDVLSRHDVIEQLATRSGTGSGRPQLPVEVSSLSLDDACAVEHTPQVVDADSSQLRALAAVARGHHMVIEGPPGTGKSQTIANLVAGALADGKTVLFVAEKQAALTVVFDRLKKCGLGDFCFEVHSSKASKSTVLRELGCSLDATLSRPAAPEFDAARLASVRTELTEYVRALHEAVQPLGRSAYAVIGRLAALSNVPETRARLNVAGASHVDLKRALEDLQQLSAAASRVGDPDVHPWRDMQRDSLDLAARETVEEALNKLESLAPVVNQAVEVCTSAFGVPKDLFLSEAIALSELADLIERSPGIERAIVSDSWTPARMADAAAVIKRGRALVELEWRGKQYLLQGVDLAALLSAAGAVERQQGSRFAWVVGEWRRARKALKAAVFPQKWESAAAAAIEVRLAEAASAERIALAADAKGRQSFGVRWHGADSNWGELEAVAAWVKTFQGWACRARLGPKACEVVERANPQVDPLRQVASLCVELQDAWRCLGGAIGWPVGYWERRPISEIAARVQELSRLPRGWRDWAEFRTLRHAAAAGVAGPMLVETQERRLPWSDLAAAFERRFYETWLGARTEECSVLRRFMGDSHEARIAEFRALDWKTIEHHRTALAAQLRARAQSQLQEAALADDVRFLRDQLARQRGHKPLRQLLRGACGAIRALKPCFLMSPMTVALCLDPEKHRFDLVVFDEASQMTPEDALGAIARGKQAVVVGDPKQLPPTNFFAVQSGQTDASAPDEDQPEFDDLDSVLELALASGFSGTSLRWHYRSRHESLIAYSNRSFYNSLLYTFPSADTDRRVRGLQFEYLAKGCYEGQGVNRAEARRVAEAVVVHSKEHPTLSLGVGTFSLAQQLAIQDELELRRREDPALEEFLSLNRAEPFFVKNLESIQGDERDVVILSITYGPSPDGTIRYNFGPISAQNGWRRLNVLTTRARERMLVISSMRADDIDLSRAQSSGAALLRAFLKYAESDVLDGNPVVSATNGADSPFEAEVSAALARAGVRVVPQVGVAGYRIDMGVLDSDVQGRFVCGIECDGVAYHSAESARDRDRLREAVLRDLGWKLHRVWSIDWWHDRKGQTERLLRLIEGSREEMKRDSLAPARGANSVVERDLSRDELSGSSVAHTTRPIASNSARPVCFAQYRMATPWARGGDILGASDSEIAEAMYEILRSEGPIHEEDLRTRALAAFGRSRAGSRIAGSLARGLGALKGRSDVECDGQSWRLASGELHPRTRAGVGIPPDRIPSWEYTAAVLAALTENKALTEEDLIATIRDAFGYGAASASLKRGVLEAVGRLTALGRVGIGSGGLGLIG